MLRTGIVIPILLASRVFAQQPIEEIEVVAQTPLGARIGSDRVASNVQRATSEQIRDQRALDLADYMKRRLAGVFVNEAQSNPLQPDVQYRGFVGSPLLGLPQGIAVYQDGVRINEPFGDTVNWALIPDFAIDSLYLVPGSNPLFGLNALGGAIAIETKDGTSHPGTSVEAYAGSFGRWGVSAEAGGSRGNGLSYYVGGSYLDENGWRDHSPTAAVQFFGDLGWQAGATSLDVNLTLADTDLIGNGASPVELLAIDRRAIFTRPDRTENELVSLNLSAQHVVTSALTLAGNLYARSSDIETLNGDDSDLEECENDPGFLCEAPGDAEALVRDPAGNPIPAEAAVQGATINRTGTRQQSVGFGLQAIWSGELGGRTNSLVFGAAYDESNVEFRAGAELGSLDRTRRAIPGGSQLGDAVTRLSADTSNLGLFVSNTFMLTDHLALMVAGRYNDAEITLRDRLGSALDGEHDFHRLNPSVGLTVTAREDLTFYASFNESNRTPSPVELTCADEDDPCRLPNAFLSDPPLEQVVARTLEFGVRVRRPALSWHAGVFRTTSRDDILFVSAGALTNEGFFSNVGETRRDGMELSIDGAVQDLTWFVSYTYLDATFRQAMTLPSPHNPAALQGEVSVSPGDRLPLIPNHLLKAGWRMALGGSLTIGGELLVGSGFHMRGDEANDLARIGDHAVVNLRADYHLNEKILLFLNVDNVLDAHYESFGLFGRPDEVLGEQFDDSRFVSPAPPRGAWLGVRVEF